MKRILFTVAVSAMISGCTRTQHNYDTTKIEEEQQTIVVDSVPAELLKKTYEEYEDRTSVEYSRKVGCKDFTMYATYNINNRDFLGEKRSSPKTEDFHLIIETFKKGARNIDRVELTLGNRILELRPNYKRSLKPGKFDLVFNFGTMLDNTTYPATISESINGTAKVVFDNGSETFTISKEEFEGFNAIYRSYLIDGGEF